MKKPTWSDLDGERYRFVVKVEDGITTHVQLDGDGTLDKKTADKMREVVKHADLSDEMKEICNIAITDRVGDDT